MFKLYVDNSWTYKEIAYRAWALRFQYEEFLASFLWDQKKERVAKRKYMDVYEQRYRTSKFNTKCRKVQIDTFTK